MRIINIMFYLVLFLSWKGAVAQLVQDELFYRVISGAKCNQTMNNGLVCKYNIGEKLSFSIKDAGGADTVVGFRYSNINEELYAVYYFDCIVVVPGFALPREDYGLDYAVFISPKNGRAYRTRKECQSVNK